MESFTENLFGLLQRQDSIFSFTLLVAAAAFLGFEAFGIFSRWRSPERRLFPKKMGKDGIEIEAIWTLIPALVLIMLSFVQVRSNSVNRRADLRLPSLSQPARFQDEVPRPRWKVSREFPRDDHAR